MLSRKRSHLTLDDTPIAKLSHRALDEYLFPQGGLNTPLNNPDFTCVVPPTNVVATPNTILATPFRSQRSDGTPMNTFNTPGGASVRTQNGVLAATPVRDKLNINPDESADGSETPLIQTQAKSSLRAALSSLPAPCNDYEIDMRDEELNEESVSGPTTDMIEDQADVDARQQQELMEESKCTSSVIANFS